MSRIAKWLPFFEQASEKRGIEQWYPAINSSLTKFGMRVRHLVTDRAKALVQLGKKEYLDVVPMPDLFHFNQTLAKKAGAIIGRAWQKATQAYEEIKASGAYYSQRAAYEDQQLMHDMCRRMYRKAICQIHQVLHPFSRDGGWQTGAQIEKTIRQSIVEIDLQKIRSKAASRAKLGEVSTEKKAAEDGMTVEDIQKLHKQIPDILSGVAQWQEWTKERITKFIDNNYIAFSSLIDKVKLEEFLLSYLLPWVYWQVTYQRLRASSKNEDLRKYYKKLIQESEMKIRTHPFIQRLKVEQVELLSQWADNIVQTFHRSSSQVEGRNGYLSFMHRANRRIPNNRLKVLTVVHNYDIKRFDGTTPAQRLFGREFPDLFEFVLENVTPFCEPRRRKRKSLTIRFVAA